MLSWSSERFVEENMDDNDWSSLSLLRNIILGGIGPIERGNWDNDEFEAADDGAEWGPMDINALVGYYVPVPDYEGAKIVSLTAPDGESVELCALGAAIANTTFGQLKTLATKFNTLVTEHDNSLKRKRVAGAGGGASTLSHEAAVKQGDVGKKVAISEGKLTIAGEERSVDWKDIPHEETIEETTISSVVASFKGAVICESGKYFPNPAVDETRADYQPPRKTKRPEYKGLLAEEQRAHTATKELLAAALAEKTTLQAEKAALEAAGAGSASQDSSVAERERLEKNITAILTRVLDKSAAIAMAVKITGNPPAAMKKEAIVEILGKLMA
jgi:hypothetical protein